VTVISAAGAAEGRLSADAALAARHRRGRHLLAPASGHWVPLDAPQVVIDAIADMLADVRASRPG
jgi:pimeloyl-ACP methyl ester carboxylesterase